MKKKRQRTVLTHANAVNPWFPLGVWDDRLSHLKLLPCQHQDTCPLNYIENTFQQQRMLCYSPSPASAAGKNSDPSASGEVSSLRHSLWSIQETEEEATFPPSSDFTKGLHCGAELSARHQSNDTLFITRQ